MTDREIAVDGTPVTFTVVQTTRLRWAAVARTHSLTITITASGVDPGAIRLRSVPDPAKTLV